MESLINGFFFGFSKRLLPCYFQDCKMIQDQDFLGLELGRFRCPKLSTFRIIKSFL